MDFIMCQYLACSLFAFMTTALKLLELQKFMLFFIIMFSSMV